MIDGETEEWLVLFKTRLITIRQKSSPLEPPPALVVQSVIPYQEGLCISGDESHGAADPTKPVEDTMKSFPKEDMYGGGSWLQLMVTRLWPPVSWMNIPSDYVAKKNGNRCRYGAAPRKYVVRENCKPGDVIILMGGRTGRDGLGGATGSSKSHTTQSIETCVQKCKRKSAY